MTKRRYSFGICSYCDGVEGCYKCREGEITQRKLRKEYLLAILPKPNQQFANLRREFESEQQSQPWN